MASPQLVTVDHSTDTTVSLVFGGPQVFRYRLWTRKPGDQAWKVFVEGSSEDGLVDTHPMGRIDAGLALAYWVGVGGDPGVDYAVSVVFTQGNAVVNGGVVNADGTTSTQGAGISRGKVAFP